MQVLFGMKSFSCVQTIYIVYAEDILILKLVGDQQKKLVVMIHVLCMYLKILV